MLLAAIERASEPSIKWAHGARLGGMRPCQAGFPASACALSPLKCLCFTPYDLCKSTPTSPLAFKAAGCLMSPTAGRWLQVGAKTRGPAGQVLGWETALDDVAGPRRARTGLIGANRRVGTFEWRRPAPCALLSSRWRWKQGQPARHPPDLADCAKWAGRPPPVRAAKTTPRRPGAAAQIHSNLHH